MGKLRNWARDAWDLTCDLGMLLALLVTVGGLLMMAGGLIVHNKNLTNNAFGTAMISFLIALALAVAGENP